MPSLSEIRSLFEEVTEEGVATREFNGKLTMSGRMIARSVFESLPEIVKKCMREVEGVCVAGGYIRDKLNGTKPGDIDLWIFHPDEKTRESLFQQARMFLVETCSFRSESKYALTYVFERTDIQLMKNTFAAPLEVIKRFDFFCCKLIIYLKNGKPVLEEDDLARENALRKILVPVNNISEPANVLRHLSKLHRKGYNIADVYLYWLLSEFEKMKPDNYGEERQSGDDKLLFGLYWCSKCNRHYTRIIREKNDTQVMSCPVCGNVCHLQNIEER